MAGVRVDPVARMARIEAGVRWSQVVEAAYCELVGRPAQ
jgi:hypothetical protein